MSLFAPKLAAATFVVLALNGFQELRAESHGDEDEGNSIEMSPGPGVGGESTPGSVRSGSTSAPAGTPTSTRTTPTTSTRTTAPTTTTTATPTATLSPTTTNSVVASLNESTSYCKQIEAKEYVIDCLAERLEEVNRQIAGLEGYEEVSKVLAETADNLNQIAKENRSETLLPAWYSTEGDTPIATERPLIPVDEAKMEDAMAQALTVIRDAETTLLLRSSEESADRASQYQRIASAIGSNKVLLRSSG
ncbi:MAG: hypothetical protein ACI8R4_002651 [Paracoccaceae bacterium]